VASTLAAPPSRARRRYPEGDLAVKLRVSHLVESVDFEPRDMPPAAILIVRRFPDPMPRRLRGDASALIPSPVWERAARSALGEIARQAARPAHAAVPSNANAVLFQDQAELLACLSRDLLNGEAGLLWWWRALLRSLPHAASSSLVEAWRRDIRYVPSVLAHLSAHGEAARTVGNLAPAEAWLLLEEMARAFELQFVFVATRQPIGSWMEEHAPLATGDRMHDANLATAISPVSMMRVAAPWQGVLASSVVPANMNRERSALLAVSLLLCQSPRLVRSQEFARAFIRWYQTPLASDHATRAPAVEADSEADSESPANVTALPTAPRPVGEYDPSIAVNPSAATVTTQDVQVAPATPDAALASSPGEPLDGTVSSREELSAARNAAGTKWAAEDSPTQSITTGIPPPEISEFPSILRTTAIEETTGAALFVEPATAVLHVKQTLAAGEAVSTSLGGALFLVNLLMALRLPNSLEQACDRELGLGSWELLELIARCLLGSGHAELAADPLWPLLLLLDGRPVQEKLGSRFAPPDCYRLPTSWVPKDLADEPPGRRMLRCCGRGLEVWNPLGFPEMVRYAEQPPSRVLIEAEIAQTGARVGLRRTPRRLGGADPLDLTLDRPLRRFAAFLMPFLRWRLEAGLGLSDVSRAELVEALLLREAKIWVTATHVDVMMRLHQVTTPVRCAGLDTDPGWVPELGRVVKFHFE
jgi:hypothetical protein